MENNSSNTSGCTEWDSTQDTLVHTGNAFICVGLFAWNKLSGIFLLHCMFVIGFMLRAAWSWLSMCSLDMFSWNFAFMFINLLHIVYILYRLRPTKFPAELEDIYESIFQPLRVSRSMFKTLTSPEICSILSLAPGEKYAISRRTNTDKLGLVVSGMVNVYNNANLLHQVDERQFLDSPEFESNVSGDDKYQVTIVAAEPVRYIHWNKQGLDAVLMKQPYLGIIMGLLIGRDITNKLYALNERAHPATLSSVRPDIRLPSLGSSHRSGTYSGGTQSPGNLSNDASCASVNVDTSEKEATHSEDDSIQQRRSFSHNLEYSRTPDIGRSATVVPVLN